MKLLKRIGIILFIFLLLIVGGVAILPYFFKDNIMATAKEEINKSINARADFKDVSLSIIRNFPNLRLGLKDFELEGIGEFEGIPLAKVASFDLVLDLASIMAGSESINLKSIHLEQPEVQVIVLENGAANYNIAKPSGPATANDSIATTDFIINLKKYSIHNANIIYDDKSTNTFVKIEELNHSGTGQFTLDIYDLSTTSEAARLTARQNGITYLDEAHTNLDAVLNIDQTNSKYTLKDNQLKINDLIVKADGFVQLLPEDQIKMKLQVKTPQNEFKHLLSMVPNAYIEGYENVKADGEFSLEALIDGIYNGVNEKIPDIPGRHAGQKRIGQVPCAAVGHFGYRCQSFCQQPQQQPEQYDSGCSKSQPEDRPQPDLQPLQTHTCDDRPKCRRQSQRHPGPSRIGTSLPHGRSK